MADAVTQAESWRVVVFTVIPDGLVYTLTDAILRPLGHRVVGVLTTPGPETRRSTDYLSVIPAVPPGIDVLVSTHPSRWAAMLAPLHPDLIVCCGFPYRIPADVLALPRLGAINVHPSLLPRHRGPWPLHWTFRSDDAEAGMTVHRITDSFDTGPILAQGRAPVTDDDDGASMMSKLVPLSLELLPAALARIANGEEGDPQDESLATEAPIFEDAWRFVDWNRSAREVHNQVRSWTGITGGSRGVVAQLDGSPILITRTKLISPGPALPAVSAGEVVRRDADSLVVQCGDNPISILAWETVGNA